MFSQLKCSVALAALLSLFGLDSALAQPGLQLSTGIDYSSGKFGGASTTDVIVAPFSARVTTGNWAFRASVPLVSIDGPGDVTVVLDDNGGARGVTSTSTDNSGRGSNSGSGGSGSSGSGSGSSGSGGSGSGGSGSGGGGSGSTGGATGGGTTVTTLQRNNRETGIGDVSLSATYSFNDIAGSAFYTDLTGRVRLPTGDDKKGLGTGATDYFLVSEVGYDAGESGVYVSGGRRFLGNVDAFKREDGWQAGAGFWVNPSKLISAGAGIDWRQSSTGSGDDPTEASAYVMYKLTPSLRIGVDAGAGFNDASPDFNVGLSLTWKSSERR